MRAARHKIIGLAIVGVLAVACVVGATWRASWIGDRLLRDWVGGTIAHQSGGVYQLDLGRVRFDWRLRLVSIDSIYLTTRPSVNARRRQALPALRLALYSCTISGVRFVTLVRNAGLVAHSLGCLSGSLVVEMQHRVHTGELGLAPAKHAHHLQPAVGHYGVFHGRRWQTETYPKVGAFIRQHD